MSADLPTFFFSHSRQEREGAREKYLDKFFDDLEITLGEVSGANLPLGTIDRRDVRQGEDWDDALSEGLRTCRSFVAVISPLFFTRKNTGKELFVFLSRSKDLMLDADGALKGVKNILPVQWQPAWVYNQGGDERGLVPKFMRKYSDVPPDAAKDKGMTDAIAHYRQRGMKGTVQAEPHYTLILEAFARALRDMKPLPAAAEISFATAEDAFSYDWPAKYRGLAASAAAAPPDITLRPLSSLVVFHITSKAFNRDDHKVSFADALICETAAASPDSLSLDLLADIRAAAAAEKIEAFNAAFEEGVPQSAESVIRRLEALSNGAVLTAVMIDAALWAGGNASPVQAMVSAVVASPNWTGPVFILTGDVASLQAATAARTNAVRKILTLPSEPTGRVPLIQSAIREARGDLLRSASQAVPDAERLPILAGVGAAGN